MLYISCWEIEFFPFFCFVLTILSFVSVCMVIAITGFSSRMASRKCVKMDDE